MPRGTRPCSAGTMRCGLWWPRRRGRRQSKLLVVRLPAGTAQKSLDLKRAICRSSQAVAQHKHLLLLPAEYEYRDAAETPRRLEQLAEMAWTRHKHTMIGALTFGAVLPTGKHAYPSSPTWMLYDGSNAKCMENLPVLISTQTFLHRVPGGGAGLPQLPELGAGHHAGPGRHQHAHPGPRCSST